jgi:hypothetical protein
MHPWCQMAGGEGQKGRMSHCFRDTVWYGARGSYPRRGGL